MTEDQYILALARALTRDEDLLAAEARPLLLELALRIRALLLTLPEGQALRAFTWRTMRLQVLELLQQGEVLPSTIDIPSEITKTKEYLEEQQAMDRLNSAGADLAFQNAGQGESLTSQTLETPLRSGRDE